MRGNSLFWLLCTFVVSVCWAQWDPGRGYGAQWDVPECEEEMWPPVSCPPCNWSPPFWPYDPIRIFLEGLGTVVGRSLNFGFQRYINLFLGVPYAKPPIPDFAESNRDRRFRPPEDPGPGWDENRRVWCAHYYRPACPQEIWKLDNQFYDVRNTSEDCLYLNIFSPNLTYRADNYDYPVFVWVHGEDFDFGDSQLYPGHLLAKKEMLVVTFNYRLGALGFLSTEDENSPGNYGLLDVLKVLEWIQLYIRLFRGDPNRVTLAGSGSGAAIVGILMSSPKAEYKGRHLFHQAIFMSGSDLCEWSLVQNVTRHIDRYRQDLSRPVEYARDLGRRVGCLTDTGRVSNSQLVNCLRHRNFEEIVNASEHLGKKYGSLSGPFGPVIDGPNGVLPDTPANLRRKRKTRPIKILAGLNRDEGAYEADVLTRDLLGIKMEDGLDPGTFRDLLYQLVRQRNMINNIHETVSAIEYEYTFWAKPDNKSAVRQNLIDMLGDFNSGWCVDSLLKNQTLLQDSAWFYVFEYRSELETLPQWMGVPRGRDVLYLWGYPFLNSTLGNITGIDPPQIDWDIIDRNMSEFVMDMWANFSKFENPTTDYIRNVTWYPYHPFNLTFLRIGEISYMDTNYRQSHFAFWREYFPAMSARWAVTTTPGPTPLPHVEYQSATWALTGATLLTLFIVIALGITLWRRSSSFSRKSLR